MEVLIDSVDVGWGGQWSEETEQNRPELLFPTAGPPLEQIMDQAAGGGGNHPPSSPQMFLTQAACPESVTHYFVCLLHS